MSQTNSQTIINRALSLADVGTEAQYISHEDRVNSINEAYRDVYKSITHSDDDYYIEKVILNPSNAQLDPDGNPNEYLLLLPNDVYKIRFVDYKGSTNWVPMRKFNPNMRDFVPSEIMYRWSGNKLWLIGSSMTGLSQIKVTYYPNPETIALQKPTQLYNTVANAYARNTAINSQPLYLPAGNAMIYNLFDTGVSNTLEADSIENGTVTTIYTAVDETNPLTGIQYVNGQLFWLGYDSVNLDIRLWRANWDGVAVVSGLTSVNIAGIDISAFSIVYDPSAGYVVYLLGSDSNNYTTDLSLSVPVAIPATTGQHDYFSIKVNGYGTIIGYIAGSVLTVDTLTVTDISRAVSDGLYIYAVNLENELVKYTVAYDAVSLTLSIDLVGTLYYNVANLTTQNTVLSLDQIENNESIYLGAIDAITSEVVSIDSNINTNLDYPLNAVYELMSYQCACDFKRKQSADDAKLLERYGMLYKRFMDSIKRDEYQPERIQNFYGKTGQSGLGW